MEVTRAIETEKFIVYRRERGAEKNVNLYFVYDKERMFEPGIEFKTIVQARKFIRGSK